MAASIWEVTQLILGAPDAGAGEVAQIALTHGFSPGEVADLLPLFLDNVRADFAEAVHLPSPTPPVPEPGEGADALAARWLSDLGSHLQSHAGIVDVVSYDSFGASGLDLGGFDPGFDPGFDDLASGVPHSRLDIDPAGVEDPASAGHDAVTAAFGHGGSHDVAAGHGGVAGDDEHPIHDPDTGLDDDLSGSHDLDHPFDGTALGDVPDGAGANLADDHHDAATHHGHGADGAFDFA